MTLSPSKTGNGTLGVRSAYVLDDEPHVVGIVCQFLVASGFVPRPFTNPIPFLAEVKSSPPELVILDLALGHSDAIDVIRNLEILKYQGKILLISGRSETTLLEVQQIGKLHGLAMLSPMQKPFRLHELKSRLATMAEVTAALPEVPDVAAASAGKVNATDLGEAMRNRWLELWYQPKIDLKALSVCGAEALLRARHPQHGIISPRCLIPPPNDPLHLPLAKFVIQQALADWQYFAEQGAPLKLAVNMPVSVLHTSEMMTTIRGSLPNDPRFPGLMIEVTEDDVIRDPKGIREIATQLRIYDTWISIDDFGAAYSSLARLRDLPCVELKLDRSFVLGCSADGSKQALCAAAIDLAHAFGLAVCAEGVEKVEDLRTLIGLGCHMAQGLLFAKPMGPKSFAKILLGCVPGSNDVQSGREGNLAANRAC